MSLIHKYKQITEHTHCSRECARMNMHVFVCVFAYARECVEYKHVGYIYKLMYNVSMYIIFNNKTAP